MESNLDTQTLTGVGQGVPTDFWLNKGIASFDVLDWLLGVGNLTAPPLVCLPPPAVSYVEAGLERQLWRRPRRGDGVIRPAVRPGDAEAGHSRREHSGGVWRHGRKISPGSWIRPGGRFKSKSFFTSLYFCVVFACVFKFLDVFYTCCSRLACFAPVKVVLVVFRFLFFVSALFAHD